MALRSIAKAQPCKQCFCCLRCRSLAASAASNSASLGGKGFGAVTSTSPAASCPGELPHTPSFQLPPRPTWPFDIACPTDERLGNFIMPATEALAGHWSTKLRANVARPLTSTALNPVHASYENNARRAGKGSLPRWSRRAGPRPWRGSCSARNCSARLPRHGEGSLSAARLAVAARPSTGLACVAAGTAGWKSLAE